MEKDLTLDDIKEIIRGYDQYVSDIKPAGPLTVIFTERVALPDGTPLPEDYELRYERRAIEYGLMIFNDINQFKNNIEEYLKDNRESGNHPPIFSFHSINRIGDSYHLRLAWYDAFWGTHKEISLERAKEILEKKPSNASLIFLQDLKAIYGL